MKLDKSGVRPRAPYVVLDVDYVNGAFVLVMHNIGSSPALKPRVEFSRDLVGVGGELVVSDLPIWQRLGLLAPDKSIRVFLDSAALVFRRKGSKRFRATVTYEDDEGNGYKHAYEHDLEAYRQMPRIEEG